MQTHHNTLKINKLLHLKQNFAYFENMFYLISHYSLGELNSDFMAPNIFIFK